MREPESAPARAGLERFVLVGTVDRLEFDNQTPAKVRGGTSRFWLSWRAIVGCSEFVAEQVDLSGAALRDDSSLV